MFKKIIVPLDGSALAAAALLPASALAKRSNAELVLVGATSTPHVAEIGAYLATMVELSQRRRASSAINDTTGVT